MSEINSGSPTRTNDALDLGDVKREVGRHAVRGGAVTIVAQGAYAVIQLGSAAALARLVSPASFGIYGMVSVVTVFFFTLSDVGLSMATAQVEELNDEQVNGLFWLNTAIGFAVMLLGVATAPVVAWFFNEPRCLLLSVATSPIFFLAGLQCQHLALLRRKMRFAAVWGTNIVSLASSVLMAILVAALGGQYWALWAMAVTQGVVSAIMVWAVSTWRPHWPPRFGEARSLVRFGLHVSGAQLVEYLSGNMDNMLVGWRWGANSLGYYGRAYSLFMAIVGKLFVPLMAIAVPALSRLQDDRERFRKGYREGLRLFMWLNCPLSLTVALASREIVFLLLGPAWDPAAWALKCFSVGALVWPIIISFNWVYVGMGHSHRVLQWSTLKLGITGLAIVGALSWGANAVALAVACSAGVSATVGSVLLLRWGWVVTGDLVKATALPSLSCLVAWGLGTVSLALLPESASAAGSINYVGAVLRLLVASLASGCSVALFAYLSGDAMLMVQRLKSSFSRRRPTEAPAA